LRDLSDTLPPDRYTEPAGAITPSPALGGTIVNILFIINDAPYGSEKAYNALRMAISLQKEQADVQVRIFLMADAVTCGLPGQATPQGYYNIERMLKSVLAKGGEIHTCGSCIDARGLRDAHLIEGVSISTMSHLTQWTVEADKVLTF
jgi:uncharacterized protein involved in oxidation of intracellular sulfur